MAIVLISYESCLNYMFIIKKLRPYLTGLPA